MIHFVFSDKDNRYMFLKGDTEEDIQNLEYYQASCNLTDPRCFLKSYKKSGRPPFTQDFIFDYKQTAGTHVFYGAIGMWQTAFKFFRKNNIAFDGLVENQHMFKHEIKHTYDEFVEIIRSWNLLYFPREYQLQAAYKILQYRQSLSVLSTRAGKTLIAYVVFRYAMQYMGMKRVLMIVPSVQLVTQGYTDFQDYAEFFKTECIWSGGKLVESANLTIGTFQSLIGFIDRTSRRYNPHFFDTYDCVFVDEVHRATAEQIRNIISQPFMKQVKIAFGMTGTLPKENTIPAYCLHSLLGAKIQDIEPRELMDSGYISDVDITQIRLSYKNRQSQVAAYIKCAEYAISRFVDTEDKHNKKQHVPLEHKEHQIQYVKELPIIVQNKKTEIYETNTDINTANIEYAKYLNNVISESDVTNALVVERMMSHFMNTRIDYLCYNILPMCDKNTLILAHHTEYINYVYMILRDRYPDKHIMKITGSIKLKEREQIRKTFREHNDCILIASYGTTSTGLTLSNLCYGILFESFKSTVVNIQSIGRGLGLADNKDTYRVFDIIDVFDTALNTKAIYLQGLAKIRLYKKYEYPFKIINEVL